MSSVEFRLSMPSHEGKWSGSHKNYVIFRTMGDDAVKALLPSGGGLWWHRWEDGWVAQVSARVMRRGERRVKSDGFCGYDWMVDNIIRCGDTRGHQ